MMQSNPLQSLRDIHLPDAISAWPPAPGWYLLIGAILLALSVVLIYFLKKYHRNTIKRLALKELSQLRVARQEGKEAELVLPHISYLLRQVAIYYFPEKNIAGLTGDAWLDFLNQTGTSSFTECKKLLTVAPYQRHIDKPNLDKLFDLSQTWMQQLNV